MAATVSALLKDGPALVRHGQSIARLIQRAGRHLMVIPGELEEVLTSPLEIAGTLRINGRAVNLALPISKLAMRREIMESQSGREQGYSGQRFSCLIPIG